MSLADTLQAFASSALNQSNRAIRLNWGKAQNTLDEVLVVQRIDIKEGLYTGIEGHLTCLSTRSDLPLKAFLGLPVAVRLVTDRGALHDICGLITDARAGQSDGSLATYQLTLRDALSVLERRINTRIFRTKSVLDVIETLLKEWQSKSPALARAFDFDLSATDRSRYPLREMTVQFNESDADFIRRLCRREGIAWFTAAGKRAQDTSSAREASLPIHTLVFCDDPMKLPQASAGTVRYHREAATEERDGITLWSTSQQIVSGSVQRASADYKSGKMAQSSQISILDQGEAGNDLAQLLADNVIDVPHAGDSNDDYQRLTTARMLSHELQAASVEGAGGVRDLAVGRWFELTGHPEISHQTVEQRQFMITRLHHRGQNNLPKELNERAQWLFDSSRWSSSVPGASSVADPMATSDTRYHNSFSCVRRGVALTPAYDPRIDLPRVHPITAWVVGPQNEEVHCDELGRIKVQLQGLNPEDHAHAQGAGASGTDADSAYVRVSSSWAGNGYGHDTLPRVGMEVALDFLNGDPDKMFVTGVLHNGPNMPATFSHTGALPGNRFLSGMKTKEIKANRYNQLRFDDTPGQISSQLASEHAASELNLGYLTQPRTDGHGQARGEGAELRTDAAAALRAAQGILLTTYARNKATGQMLDREELNQLLGQCTELFKSLGDYAGQHGGKAADGAGQNALAGAFKNWDASSTNGSQDSAAATATAAPAILAFGAVTGSVAVTPKTQLTYAGENIDQVAQQHLQLMSGQRFNATAGQGMQLFARGTGIQAIAAEGPMLLQAQNEALTANAQKGVKISTNENEVLITAPTIRLVAEDGSYIKIGAGVTMGTKGDIKLLSASHQWGGPSTEQATKTSFSNAPTDQRFRLHYPGESADTAPAAANQSYRITLDDGRVIEGKSDANGLTELVKDDAMRILKIDILKPAL
ncbi:type VI secretion system secreted protein VgrG [Herbaspirillum rubrisubalbicans]|uniref:type VI secretion system Vgr family protein n=1 Tax=Herbaspirillum rubrisubalbicans TaxID=80842 RepID=UPI00209F4335|nr:type VI secretion system Vgr family protein [Herbaspirillum rubrisubalbicans]MCP1571725.1 type VI secretion system secreted protein VgrG [Herbaspirillum rubrisubalbicans]